MDLTVKPNMLSDSDPTRQTPLVLIAEDSPSMLALIRHVMELEGYRVVAATTGLEAVQLCTELDPDVILLDYVMPKLDGVDACARIRALENHKTTPVLVITGMNDDTSIERAINCGADDYITKPILLPVLRQRVRKLLTARRAERVMTHLAYHDPLTNLPNRLFFQERIEDALKVVRLDDRRHALMYLDLDQFKVVNDSCGHSAGDELLCQLTALLRGCLRKHDVIARLGGDEFGVLAYDCDVEEARKLADKLRQAVASFRFVWQTRVFAVGVSIGLVPINAETENVSGALSVADTACYVAKEGGRNRVQVYQPDNQELLRRRTEMSWVGRITRALEEERFRLTYQPIMALDADRPSGLHFEILLYMIDEAGERTSPATFIPAAERYNLMPTIDRWVIRQTLDFVDRYLASGRNLETCCINLSGASLGDDDLLGFIHQALAVRRIPAHKICFEITETATIGKLDRAVKVIHDLRGRGCRFALDDFGTGLSSFAYLKHLPVDFLKIDGGFIRHMQRDPMDFAIVKSINEIGHALKIETIAEFVEDESTINCLRELGVDYAQGYGIARPMPLEDLERGAARTVSHAPAIA
jgi:diguanylate cyclase (GGDEF)-like protein